MEALNISVCGVAQITYRASNGTVIIFKASLTVGQLLLDLAERNTLAMIVRRDPSLAAITKHSVAIVGEDTFLDGGWLTNSVIIQVVAWEASSALLTGPNPICFAVQSWREGNALDDCASGWEASVTEGANSFRVDGHTQRLDGGFLLDPLAEIPERLAPDVHRGFDRSGEAQKHEKP